MLSEQTKGDLNIYASAILWAIFPIITVFTYTNIAPLPSLAFSTLFACCLFTIIITLKKKWHEIANPDALKNIFYVALFIGVGFYSFTFIALSYTTAGNVSLIALLEILFSYMLFNMWKREQFSLQHIVGSLLMIIGAIIVLSPNTIVFNKGDFFVVAAALCAPFGNYFQQKARQQVSSEMIMFVRSFLTTIIVFLLAFAVKQSFSLMDVRRSLWFLVVNGFLLLGISKILWIEGIHRVSVTRANALSSISPPLTLVFAYFLLGQSPTVFQLIAFFPLVAGLLLLTINKSR